jgi:hypothetical protein
MQPAREHARLVAGFRFAHFVYRNLVTLSARFGSRNFPYTCARQGYRRTPLR